ncbi:MAG: hypothetical protein ACKVIG_02265 [Flavobacteriales bacterium]
MKLKFKDRLIIYVFPYVVKLLHFIGFSYEKIGNYAILSKSTLLEQAKHLSRYEVDTKKKSQNIYAATILTGGMFMLIIESLLALGLKKRGHKVTFIIDDNILPIHEFKKIGNENFWDYQSTRDFIFAATFLRRLNLDYITISEFIGNTDQLKFDKKYNSILEASLLKHYKVGVISKELPLLEHKISLIKKSIAITALIGKNLLEENPDLVMMSHGIYSTWGPIFQALDNNRIPVLMYGRGKKRHTLKFDWNQTGDSWNVSEEWEKVKYKDLTKSELIDINDYLDSRISHKDDVFVYNFGKPTSHNQTIENLGLDPQKPIYTLFTNVLWDAASAQREIAFNNPVEWVIETIEWFNNNPEKQLIVKIHPAEVVIGTNMPFYNIIHSRITPGKNIRVIQPNEKVNSWSIYAISKLGIVHTTTAGMEMPLVHKPCIVVSKTHYREKGFTLDVNSKEEYFNLLLNFDDSQFDFEKNKKEALKYAYLLFIRYQIPFNLFYEPTSTDIKGYRKNSLDEYFTNDSFNMVIDCIEKRKPIFN